MKRFCFLLAGLALLAGKGLGPAQVPGVSQAQLYEVNPTVGPWMIFIQDYRGDHAREWAVKFAEELRNTYRLPAYIFNYSDEERRKERERVAELRERQRRFLQQIGAADGTRIRIRTIRFDDQYAVLMGGFKDQETARKELDRVRKLKPPDPKRVALATKGYMDVQKKNGEACYINPFQRAFVVPNPTVKRAPAQAPDKPDPALQKFNDGEPYSLLRCPKPFTLAVAQFHGGSVVQVASKSTGGKFLEALGLGSGGETLSASALNAHNLAEFLRTKLNFEAYVLHTRYYSVVCVGGFDSPDEPGLGAVKNRIVSLGLSRQPLLSMLPEPIPMKIPRP